MNKKFNDICEWAEGLTLCHMPSIQIQLELSRMSETHKKRISCTMWDLAGKIDSSEYDPNQGFVILATYAAAIADDFNTNANVILIAMFTTKK